MEWSWTNLKDNASKIIKDVKTPKSKLVSCGDCDKTISRNAASCPYCGAGFEGLMRTWTDVVSFIMLIPLFIAIIFGICWLICTALMALIS